MPLVYNLALSPELQMLSKEMQIIGNRKDPLSPASAAPVGGRPLASHTQLLFFPAITIISCSFDYTAI